MPHHKSKWASSASKSCRALGERPPNDFFKDTLPYLEGPKKLMSEKKWATHYSLHNIALFCNLSPTQACRQAGQYQYTETLITREVTMS